MGNATGALEAYRRAIKATEIISERIEAVDIEHGDLPPLKYGISCIWVTSFMVTSASLSGENLPSSARQPIRPALIESMTKELQELVLISSIFADTFPGKLTSVNTQ